MTWRAPLVSVALALAAAGLAADAKADGWSLRGRSAFEHHPDWRDRSPPRPSPYWRWLDRSDTWPQQQRHRAPPLSWEERRHLQALDYEIEALLRRSFADGRLGRYERERLALLRDRRDRLALDYLRDGERRW